MPYSTELEARLNSLLYERQDEVHKEIELKKMFGGLAYLLRGKMSVGIMGENLMVRIPAGNMEEALEKQGAHPMEFTGRPMKEFVMVEPEGYKDTSAMNQWIEWGLEHARGKLAEMERKRKK